MRDELINKHEIKRCNVSFLLKVKSSKKLAC